MEKIILLWEVLLKVLGFEINENNTIRKSDTLLSPPLECNGKVVLVDYNSAISKFKNYILLKIDSAAISCTYHILDKYITIKLSSKVKLVVDKLIKFVHTPELHSKAKSERLNGLLASAYLEDGFDIEDIINETLSQKFLMLNKLIRDNNVRDSFIKLSLKSDYMIIEDTSKLKAIGVSKIQDSGKYISNDSYIEITFPYYELLKNRKSNKLLGIEFTEKEINTLRSIHQNIFKNIDENHGYRLNESPLFKENKDDKQEYKIIYGDPKQDTIKLIKAFVHISKEINKTLDDLSFMDSVEDEKIDLANIEELICEIEAEPLLLPQVDHEGTHDVIKEKKRDKPCDLHALNKTLNAKPAENELISVVDTEQTATKKRSSYKKGTRKNRNVALSPAPFMSSVNLPRANASTSSLVLDPTDDSFDNLLSKEEREVHRHVSAGTGGGKSELSKAFALKDIQDTKSNFILIDGGQKLAKELPKLVEPERLVILNQSLSKDKDFGFNPLELEDKSEENVAIQSKHLAKSFELIMLSNWSDNMEAVLVPLLYVLMYVGGYTLYDLKRLLDDDNYEELKSIAMQCPHKHHRDFIINDLHRIKSIKQTKDAIFMKLQALLTDEVLARSICNTSTIDFEKQINTPGKVIIVKPDSSALGIFFMARIQGIVEKRDTDNFIHTHLYIDEFQNYVSSSSSKMLSEYRKKGLHMTMIHQDIEQIKDIKSNVFANTDTKIVGKNSHDNLKIMSKELQVDIKELQKLGIGEFYIKHGTKEAVKIKVTDKFIDQNGAMSDAQWKECVANQLELYYESNDTSDKTSAPTVIAQKSESITKELDLKKQLEKEFSLATDSSTTADAISDDF